MASGYRRQAKCQKFESLVEWVEFFDTHDMGDYAAEMPEVEFTISIIERMRQMERTFTVVFDGEVFRPDTPVDVEPNTRYVVTINEAVFTQADAIDGEPATKSQDEDENERDDASAWAAIDALVGTVEGPADWAEEHDHYLYGTPKRNQA